MAHFDRSRTMGNFINMSAGLVHAQCDVRQSKTKCMVVSWQGAISSERKDVTCQDCLHVLISELQIEVNDLEAKLAGTYRPHHSSPQKKPKEKFRFKAMYLGGMVEVELEEYSILLDNGPASPEVKHLSGQILTPCEHRAGTLWFPFPGLALIVKGSSGVVVSSGTYSMEAVKAVSSPQKEPEPCRAVAPPSNPDATAAYLKSRGWKALEAEEGPCIVCTGVGPAHQSWCPRRG